MKMYKHTNITRRDVVVQDSKGVKTVLHPGKSVVSDIKSNLCTIKIEIVQEEEKPIKVKTKKQNKHEDDE